MSKTEMVMDSAASPLSSLQASPCAAPSTVSGGSLINLQISQWSRGLGCSPEIIMLGASWQLQCCQATCPHVVMQPWSTQRMNHSNQGRH